MSDRVRVFAFGFLGGLLLSAMRAPLGLDLLRAVSIDGATAGAIRAAALLGLAVALFRAPALGVVPPIPTLLFSLTAGFATHGLLLENLVPLGTRLELAIAFVAVVAAMWFVGRGTTAAVEPAPDAETPPEDAGGFERAGIVIGSAAAAIAVESIARRLRLLGLGLPQDDTVMGIVFLFLLAFGAAAFGGMVPVARRGRVLLGLGLAAGTMACALASTRLLEFGEARRLATVLQKFGSLGLAGGSEVHPLQIGLGHLGTWRAGLVFAFASLIVPALALGFASTGARGPVRLGCVALGAAIGSGLVPFAFGAQERALGFDDLPAAGVQATILGGATVAAGLAAALAVLGRSGTGERALGIVGGLLVAGASTGVVASDAWLFSPWDSAPLVEPMVTVDGADGQLTVEKARDLPILCIDRKRLTPTSWEEAADTLRIEMSLDLVGDSPRVLLVGQLTPSRAALFARRGVAFDRTSTWQRWTAEIEAQLFIQDPDLVPSEPALTLTEARARLADGGYDLVLVLPIYGARLPSLPAQYDSAPGPAPRTQGWSVPDDTIAVVWVDASAELSTTELRDRVLVCPLPIEEPTLGLVLGSDEPVGFPGADRTLSPLPIQELTVRGYQRQHRARARVFARLAEASEAEGGRVAALARFYAGHFAVQNESSPFLTESQKVEVDDAALAALSEAATTGEPLDRGLRALCEAVAETLTERREPRLALDHLAPIAEAVPGWTAMDKAVVASFMEFDMAEEVVPRLEDLLERVPYDLGLLESAAKWAEGRGDVDVEAGYLRRILAIQPTRSTTLVRIADLAEEHGFPDAAELRRRADAAVDANPDDPHDHAH